MYRFSVGVFTLLPNTKKAVIATAFFVGEDGFEPPKVKTSRFTVCPIWPLWYSPIASAKIVIKTRIMQVFARFFLFFRNFSFGFIRNN